MVDIKAATTDELVDEIERRKTLAREMYLKKVMDEINEAFIADRIANIYTEEKNLGTSAYSKMYYVYLK